MDAAHCLDLSCVPPNVVIVIFQGLSLSDRFSCALACKAWAEAATAATRSIVLRHRLNDRSCLKTWLEKHGSHLEVLQLHDCGGAVLTALPCPQLQDLLLKAGRGSLSVDSSVWQDIAAATKLTSVTLRYVETACQQADVVSALTALPDLEQLTWHWVNCGGQWGLTDSVLLQKLTNLTAVHLASVPEAGALEHLGLLTRLQDLSLVINENWAAAACPGLQELKALTRLELSDLFDGMPASVSQLTALQQLDVKTATPTALITLSTVTGLTHLRMREFRNLSPGSPPLQLPALQHLEVTSGAFGTMPVSFLASCTQLQLLELDDMNLSPGSLVTNTMLQHLQLYHCRISATDDAVDAAPWQQLFPVPGRLPHLTSLQLAYSHRYRHLQLADIECVVACCSSLQVLHLDTLPDNSAAALTHLRGLTSLTLWLGSDQQCRSVAQLTGLRELRVTNPKEMSVAGLVQLAALKELTCLGFGYTNGDDRCLGDKVHPVVWRQMSDKVPECMYGITNKAPSGHPSDVPARLLQACDLATAADS